MDVLRLVLLNNFYDFTSLSNLEILEMLACLILGIFTKSPVILEA